MNLNEELLVKFTEFWSSLRRKWGVSSGSQEIVEWTKKKGTSPGHIHPTPEKLWVSNKKRWNSSLQDWFIDDDFRFSLSLCDIILK